MGTSLERLIGHHVADPVGHLVREDPTGLSPGEHPALAALVRQQPRLDVIPDVDRPGVDRPGVDRRFIKSSAFHDVGDDRVEAVTAHFTALVASPHELHATNERLKLVAQFPTDVVVLASRDAVGERASDSMTDLLGLSPRDVVGRRIDRLVRLDDLGNNLDVRRLAPNAQNAQFLVRRRR